MSLKQPSIVLAAAALCAVIGSGAVSAQENCGAMHHRVMEAYQGQSPHYSQMLNHYNARCLSGSSSQPTWGADNRYRYDNHRRGHDNDLDHDGDRWRRGW